MDSDRTTFEPAVVTHPGETVVEYLEFNGWSQRDLARRTGLTPKTISEICSGKAPITPTTSLAFEKAFQRPAHLWLNLQRQFDEAAARQREIARSTEWIDWAAKFPLKEMRRFGWLPAKHSKRLDVEALLGFLGVSSPSSWHAVWSASQVAYRQTRRFQTSAEAISAWVRATELEAMRIPIGDFDEGRLRDSIDALRHFTAKRAEETLDPVQKICAAAGVAVVWVPELKYTGISGCARWLGEKKALVALTLRYKTDDQMWFTFFHEIGHILLHRRKRSFVLDNADESVSDNVVDPQMQQYEDEANRFASDALIPPAALEGFINQGEFTNQTIFDFSDHLGIGPGIVVGRLQREGLLEPYQGNKLKQKLGWKIAEDGEEEQE